MYLYMKKMYLIRKPDIIKILHLSSKRCFKYTFFKTKIIKVKSREEGIKKFQFCCSIPHKNINKIIISSFFYQKVVDP